MIIKERHCNPTLEHRPDNRSGRAGSMLLFVYGTLMRGQPAHGLLRGARLLLGHATTPPGFTLYDLGPYPAAVLGQGHGRVHGELYAIPPTLLRRLDAYECCPREFQRITIPTLRGRAWIYVYPAPPLRGHPLRYGSWRRRS